MRIVDLSFDIESGMPTCGTPWHQVVEVSAMGTIPTVGRNTSKIVVGSHSGTHMDAPKHFIEGDLDISDIPVSSMIGEATVIDFRYIKKDDVVTLKDVEQIDVYEKMIFCFGWYKNWGENYYKGFPYFEEAAVKLLVDKGMKYMAMDTPSPDNGNAIGSLDNDSPNHMYLLEAGVIIVEYLNNTDSIVNEKTVEIISLPLKVKGADGCPCRVVARCD